MNFTPSQSCDHGVIYGAPLRMFSTKYTFYLGYFQLLMVSSQHNPTICWGELHSDPWKCSMWTETLAHLKASMISLHTSSTFICWDGGLPYVTQTSLELSNSSDPPTSVSQVLLFCLFVFVFFVFLIFVFACFLFFSLWGHCRGKGRIWKWVELGCMMWNSLRVKKEIMLSNKKILH